CHCVIFGEGRPANAPDLRFESHYMGHLNDDFSLVLLYNALDVLVVPSRQDNLPQCATEALACRCPVVAFATTRPNDIVEHGKTGYLAQPYEPDDLAHGILQLLNNEGLATSYSVAARQRAINMWSFKVVAGRYRDLYATVLAEQTYANSSIGAYRA